MTKNFLNGFVGSMSIFFVVGWLLAQGDTPVCSSDRLLCALIVIGYATYVRIGEALR